MVLLMSTLGSTSILDVLYYLSAVKALITVIKYVPQVLLNMRNRSTMGWSMENVLLDFIGGVCSLAQSVVDALNSDNMDLIFGNPIKLALGLISLMFDITFIFQYFYYRNQETLQDSEPLLEETEIDSATNLEHENTEL